MNDEQAPEQQSTELALQVIPPEPVNLRPALTIRNLWHVWVGLKSTARPNTLLLYHSIGKRFCRFFSPKSGHTFDRQGMLEWMQYLQAFKNSYRHDRPLSAVRINRINTTVKAFIRWLKVMGYLSEDIGECLPYLMVQAPKDPEIITEEEYEKLKAWCAGREWCQPHLWLMILAYRTGMSLIDCCHLRWRDVHLNDDGHSYIDIRRIKTQRLGEKADCKIPIVPFSDIHLWLLNLKKAKRWKRADGVDDYVHQDTQGLYVTTMGSIRGDFYHIFIQAGVPRTKTFKCFRNSLCSNLVNSGAQIALVCKITGHNSVKMLLRYLKPDRRALQDGMSKAQQYSALKGKIVNSNDGFQEGDSAYL